MSENQTVTTSDFKDMKFSRAETDWHLFIQYDATEPAEVKRLIAEFQDAIEEETGKAKGDKLEELAHYLLEESQLGSTVARRNIKNEALTMEIDHSMDFGRDLASYFESKIPSNKRQGYTFKLIGESKCLKKAKIDVTQVYKLAGKLYIRNAFMGVFFSTNGLTGDVESAAKKLAVDFYNTLGIVILWFSNEDWAYLSSNPRHFVLLFNEKLELFLNSDTCEVNYDSASFQSKVEFLRKCRPEIE